jgi:uncharacterized membrane protein YhaH (DUF805 family)
MKWLDFLFWHYYSYFEQNKKRFKGDRIQVAEGMILITTSAIIGSLVAIMKIFVYNLYLPDYGRMKMWAWTIGIPWILYLDYRYERKKSIVQNKYQIFRERWGEPENVSKKNLKILLWYTLITTIGMLLFAIAMGYLNKHGYFEGCRLFP